MQGVGRRVWGAGCGVWGVASCFDWMGHAFGRDRCHFKTRLQREREFFIDNLQVGFHFIIAMIRWTGLAPWEVKFPFPGSRPSTFLTPADNMSTTSSHDRVSTRHDSACSYLTQCINESAHSHLTQCINLMVSEGRIPHKNVSLLSAITN